MMIMIIIIMPLLFRPAESLCRVKLSAGGRSARRRRVEETPKADTQPRPDHASHEIHGVPATEHRRHSIPDRVPHGEKKKSTREPVIKKTRGLNFAICGGKQGYSHRKKQGAWERGDSMSRSLLWSRRASWAIRYVTAAQGVSTQPGSPSVSGAAPSFDRALPPTG